MTDTEREEALCRIKEILRDKRKFSTMSDAGSVLVGVDGFGFMIPNGRGDGRMEVAVIPHDGLTCEERRTIRDDMEFFSCMRGPFNIYGYDCSPCAKKDIVYSSDAMDTRYGIYYLDGIVVIYEWAD